MMMTTTTMMTEMTTSPPTIAIADHSRGDPIAEPISVALDDVVRTSLDLARPAAEDAGVSLVSELVPVRVPGDPHLLAEVASNLITNGIRYSSSGSIRQDLARTGAPGSASRSLERSWMGTVGPSAPRAGGRTGASSP